MSRRVNKYFCAVLLSALIIFLRPGPEAAAGAVTEENPGNVRILILSKDIRKLGEKGAGPMSFDLPPGSYVITSCGTIPLKKLIISRRNGRFELSNGQAGLPPGRLLLTNGSSRSYFTYRAGNDTRLYPLPLEIFFSESEVRLIATENIRSYAIDSAHAELGFYSKSSEEALYALAHAIFARALAAREGAKHSGAHFCDLTCCQSYRGRCGLEFSDTTTISPESGSRIFFGSSGGGIILTGRVFGSDESIKERPQRDVIYSENFTLSMKNHKSWIAEISSAELNSILYEEIKRHITDIFYSPMKEAMVLNCYEGPLSIAPETFRLIVNRKKGWSFIRSNNYSVTLRDGVFTFSGSGLGHCAGMSIEGAVQLAGKGYSRYEILEHYYPWIRYSPPEKSGHDHYFRHVTFDTMTGRLHNIPAGDSFLERRVPFGSVSKLVTLLYLATERKDLFYNHRYRCTGSEKDPLMPARCWDTEGHGNVDISSAIYNSCNLFFASLHSEISLDSYMLWLNKFSQDTGIEVSIPQVKTEKEFALFLAGLNFDYTINIKGLIRLAMLVSEGGCSDARIEKFRERIGPDEFNIICSAMHDTMDIGTGSIKKERHRGTNPSTGIREFMWGKTGTVIAGTNSHCGYGLFLGGYRNFGIVAILRKGTGAVAADYSAATVEMNYR